MKTHSLAILALTLVLGACTTRTSVQSAPPRKTSFRLPLPTGIRTTLWGDLPTYDQNGHYFTNLTGRPPVNAFDSTVTLDLLVNRDGSVQDIALRESSGNQHVDEVSQKRFKRARYSLVLRPEDPAPYVVREWVTYRTDHHFSYGMDPSQHRSVSGPQQPNTVYGPPR